MKNQNEIEEILNISDITPYHLQHEKLVSRTIEAYKKLKSENQADGHNILLKDYARSPFRGFEPYLRLVVSLDEEDIQLILKQYILIFVTCILSRRIYAIEGFSEAVYTMGDHPGTRQIDYDDITMKTKLVLTHFMLTFRTLGFDEETFLKNSLGIVPYWDYKLTNASDADSPSVYIDDKYLNLSSTNKIHLKADVINQGYCNQWFETT